MPLFERGPGVPENLDHHILVVDFPFVFQLKQSISHFSTFVKIFLRLFSTKKCPPQSNEEKTNLSIRMKSNTKYTNDLMYTFLIYYKEKFATGNIAVSFL